MNHSRFFTLYLRTLGDVYLSINFKEGVDKLKIKILTNNTVDMTLTGNPKLAGKVTQPTQEVASAVAEHGLAMHINIDGIDILYDFGGLAFAILKNLEIFKIDPKIFNKVVLSHGHFDHFGSMFKLAPLLKPGAEIILSPDAYDQKLGYIAKSGGIIDIKLLQENFKTYKKEGKVALLPPLKKKAVDKTAEMAQLKIIETKEPIELAPSVWTSGEIKISDKSELTRNLFLKIGKNEFKEDTFRDEIAIYIKVKNKGMVVLTGCGHCGIINTIKHCQEISGENKIYAVIGGFHLNWSTDEQLDKVINYFKELQPDIICGMHCTGFKFNSKLSEKMPDNMTLGVVGTEFNL